MQLKCPIQSCGRQFESQLTMIQHVKRRHPLQSQKIRQKTTNQMLQKQSKITQELNKLPKMQRVMQMSKQKKPLQFQRRSASKKRKELVNIVQNSQIKLNDIITESRQMVDQNSNSRKILKRPSLSKKSSEEISDTKLPSLTQSKVKKLKLQALKSQFNNSFKSQLNNTILNEAPSQKNLSKDAIILQSQSQMYSTAPNFASQMNKKIQSIRSRSKGKKQQGEQSNRSSSKDFSTIQTKSIMHKKTASNLDNESLIQSQKTLQQQKPKPIQRPVKKLLQRSSLRKQKQKTTLVNQALSESVFIQKSSQDSSPSTNNLKQFSFEQKLSRNKQKQGKFTKKSSPSHNQIKKPSTLKTQTSSDDINWQQRTLTIRNQVIQRFQIPFDSSVQYLFIHNCQISEIDLSQCFSLIQLSLNNNLISNFQFLEESINGSYQNLESLYMDHNRITSLQTLPKYLQLKRLSLTFNQISGLQETVKILAKLPSIEQIDFSFNPLRKQTNYKLAIISVCKNLKKLDGMVITKFDRQLSAQYDKIYFQCHNILPLNENPSTFQDKFRPSTAVSINYQQDLQSENMSCQLSEQQLQKQIEILQKMIKNTKSQYEIIQDENAALEEQIQSYQADLSEQQLSKQQFNPKLYKKLCKQVQELQMLNFLQYASQKQLEDLIHKKAKQKGVNLELLLTN